ncbi:hypothetical protein B0O80DRAFT_498780 [Mortierella sp. GBAus27b]|nr:hypothetical protein BGX31_009234 [Mortierella sp. GBA43]KAI8353939.1 hypothetical protein B0O80DRAFT_498780 [Mortierella sp. GBAus27b]
MEDYNELSGMFDEDYLNFTHSVRNDYHFADFLMEIIIYELASSIHESKNEDEFTTAMVQRSILFARSKMYTPHIAPGASEAETQRSLNGVSIAGELIPPPFYDFWIASAPYSLGEHNICKYLEDPWRSQRLFIRPIRIRGQTHIILPRMTSMDHDFFQRQYARVHATFQDRYALVVHQLRESVWKHGGSGGRSVLDYRHQRVLKYTSAHNTQLRDQWHNEGSCDCAYDHGHPHDSPSTSANNNRHESDIVNHGQTSLPFGSSTFTAAADPFTFNMGSTSTTSATGAKSTSSLGNAKKKAKDAGLHNLEKDKDNDNALLPTPPTSAGPSSSNSGLQYHEFDKEVQAMRDAWTLFFAQTKQRLDNSTTDEEEENILDRLYQDWQHCTLKIRECVVASFNTSVSQQQRAVERARQRVISSDRERKRQRLLEELCEQGREFNETFLRTQTAINRARQATAACSSRSSGSKNRRQQGKSSHTATGGTSSSSKKGSSSSSNNNNKGKSVVRGRQRVEETASEREHGLQQDLDDCLDDLMQVKKVRRAHFHPKRHYEETYNDEDPHAQYHVRLQYEIDIMKQVNRFDYPLVIHLAIFLGALARDGALPMDACTGLMDRAEKRAIQRYPHGHPEMPESELLARQLFIAVSEDTLNAFAGMGRLIWAPDIRAKYIDDEDNNSVYLDTIVVPDEERYRARIRGFNDETNGQDADDSGEETPDDLPGFESVSEDGAAGQHIDTEEDLSGWESMTEDGASGQDPATVEDLPGFESVSEEEEDDPGLPYMFGFLPPPPPGSFLAEQMQAGEDELDRSFKNADKAWNTALADLKRHMKAEEEKERVRKAEEKERLKKEREEERIRKEEEKERIKQEKELERIRKEEEKERIRKEEEEERIRKEEEERVRKEEEERIKKKEEERIRKEEEERIRKEEEERIRKEEEERIRKEEEHIRKEEEERIKEEEERIKREEEKRIRKEQEMAELASRMAETERAAKEASTKDARVTFKEAVLAAKAEKERIAREEAEKAVARRVVKEQLDRIARERVQAAQKAAAQQKAEDAKRAVQEQIERVAREKADAEQLVRDRAEQAAKVEAEQQAKELAEHLAWTEASRLSKEAAKQLKQEEDARIAEEEKELQASNKKKREAHHLVLQQEAQMASLRAQEALQSKKEIEHQMATGLTPEQQREQTPDMKAHADRFKADRFEEIAEMRRREQEKTETVARDAAWAGGRVPGERYDRDARERKVMEDRIEEFKADRYDEIAEARLASLRDTFKESMDLADQELRLANKASEEASDALREWELETKAEEEEERKRIQDRVARKLEESKDISRQKFLDEKEAAALATKRNEPIRLANMGATYFDWQGLNFTLSLWKQPQQDSWGDMTAVAQEWIFNLLPTEEVVETRNDFLDRLQRLFNNEFPGQGLKLRPFGSFITGLGNHESDIDICIFSEVAESHAVTLTVTEVATFLDKHNMENVVAITEAKVPIVRFVDPSTRIACDMNIQHSLGIHNSMLIKAYLDIDERLVGFLTLLKYFAKCHKIHDASVGYLSSYAYNLMGIVFFQQQRDAILPRLQSGNSRPRQYDEAGVARERMSDLATCLKNCSIASVQVHQPDGIYDCSFDTRTEEYKSYGLYNKKTIVQLLFEFFEYFSRRFDYRTMEVSPLYGRFREQYKWQVEKERQMQAPSSTPLIDTEATTLVTTTTAENGTASPSTKGTTSTYVFDLKRNTWLSAAEQAYFKDLDEHGGIPSGEVPIPGVASASALVSTFSNSALTNPAKALATPRNKLGSEVSLRVMDPFIPNRNTAGTCRGERLIKVWKCFDYAYKCLAQGKFEEAFHPFDSLDPKDQM